MKKKNLFLSALLAGTIFMANSQTAFAQFHMAAKTDNVAKSSAVGITNTGNDMIEVNGNLFKAMVWDGTGTGANAPGYSVNYNGSTFTGVIGGGAPGISDPDVVAFQYGANVRLLITYIRSGAVNYDVILFNTSTSAFSVQALRFVVSTTGTYPNVDKDLTGQAVIVYQKNQGIYARALDLGLATFSPTSLTPDHRVDDGSWTGYNRLNPDVTVKRNAAGTNAVVTFVYENEDPSLPATDIMITQESLTSVRTTTASASASSQTVYWPLNFWDKPQYPRIAAQKTSHNSDNDFVAVFQENDNKIVSLGTWDNYVTWNSYIVNDGSTGNQDITNAENIRPAVTFSGDHTIAAWAFHDKQGELGSNDRDILAARLQWNGNPHGDGYSVVNFDIRGDQVAPSVSGLFVPSEVCYTFYDASKLQVLYKTSFYNNQNLRTSGSGQVAPSISDMSSDKLSVYPNPITEASQLEIILVEGSEAKSLELYDLTGKKVATLAANKLKTGENHVRLQNELTNRLPEGMYFLRLVTNRGQHTFKLQK